MALNKKALDQLAARAIVRPHVAKLLAQYQRHTLRIGRLQRVLDPDDTDAIGNPVSGNDDSYRAEIERREAQVAQLVPHLEIALSAPLSAAEQKQVKQRAAKLAAFKQSLGL